MARADPRMLAKEIEDIKDQLSGDSGFFSGDHDERLRDLEAKVEELRSNWVGKSDYKTTVKSLITRLDALEKNVNPA